MYKKVGFIAALAVLGSAPFAMSTPLGSTGTYKIDESHSSCIFRIKHLNVSYFYGRFNDIEGQINWNEESPATSSLEISIKTKSVDTDSSGRDKHLRSPDFFSAKEFKEITFKSTTIKPKDKDTFEVTGDLTLHGTTKSITVDLDHTGSGPGMRGGELIGFEAIFTIKRSEFGMSTMLDKLGDEVRLMIGIEAMKS